MAPPRAFEGEELGRVERRAAAISLYAFLFQLVASFGIYEATQANAPLRAAYRSRFGWFEDFEGQIRSF